jgi:murein DD-endopeptidase MepM/ murein hydrolase activator NlpD
VVIAAGPRGGYGNAIELAHADGTSTLYAHASEVEVTPGEHVAAGEIIGLVGQTGRTTGPHLHLEVRRGGQFLDPQTALKTYRLRAEESGGGVP